MQLLLLVAVNLLLCIQMAHPLPVSLQSSEGAVASISGSLAASDPNLTLPAQNLPGTDQTNTNSPPLGAYMCQGQTLLQLQVNSTSDVFWNTLETCGNMRPTCLVLLVASPMFIGCTTQIQADAIIANATINAAAINQKFSTMSASQKAQLAQRQHSSYKSAAISAILQVQSVNMQALQAQNTAAVKALALQHQIVLNSTIRNQIQSEKAMNATLAAAQQKLNDIQNAQNATLVWQTFASQQQDAQNLTAQIQQAGVGTTTLVESLQNLQLALSKQQSTLERISNQQVAASAQQVSIQQLQNQTSQSEQDTKQQLSILKSMPHQDASVSQDQRKQLVQNQQLALSKVQATLEEILKQQVAASSQQGFVQQLQKQANESEQDMQDHLAALNFEQHHKMEALKLQNKQLIQELVDAQGREMKMMQGYLA
ncbi:hypothetical protein HDU98_008139 [Podochytrium sp. JEL0797]|nr:hypothetical protein HDU98_008139 [Podochytrium sp. JEL0797]